MSFKKLLDGVCASWYFFIIWSFIILVQLPLIGSVLSPFEKKYRIIPWDI